MHDKIKALLPKEKKIADGTIFASSGMYDGTVNYYRGHNACLAEVHAKIPEIVALVEGEVREKIRQLKTYEVTDDVEDEHGELVEFYEKKVLLKNDVLEALFSNKN